MTRTIVAIIVLVLIALVGIIFSRYRSVALPATPVTSVSVVAPPTETTAAAVPTKPTPTPAKPIDYRITITAEGFSPETITVQPGDTVTFVNNDTEPHWPASNPHPAHTGCSGFDADHGLAPTETYRLNYNFDQSCSYHDHLHPRLRGQLELVQ